MKKFSFNLEKLLSYKGQMLDSEMMTLAVLNSQLENAQQKLTGLQNNQKKCELEFETKIMGQATPADCQLFNNYIEHLKTQIKQCVAEISDITKQIESQIETIKKLKLETKSLDTIKASRFEEYVKEDLKSNELQLEEFVVTSRLMSNSF